MSSVITSVCVSEKATACVNVCPMECFFDAGEQLVIHPDECTSCGACNAECPVAAISFEEEVPEAERPSIAFNRWFVESLPPDELEKRRVTV